MDVRAGYKRTKLGWIPEEWETATIGDISEKIVGGGTPSREKPEYYNGSIPWLTVKDLSENSFYKSSTLESITETAIKESSANLIPKDNVIISTRMALGKGFINKMDIAINQDMKALFLDKSVATNEFFLYWYRSKSILFEKMGSGTTVKGIALKALKNVLLPLPPIPEQKKIADILTTVDDKIASIEDRIQQTEQLKKGLMEKLLTEGIGHTEFKDTKIGKVPKKWVLKKLNDVLEFMTDYVANGSFKSLRENVSVYENENYAIYVRLVDLRAGLGHNGQKYVDKHSYHFLSKSNLYGNELLLANIGANVGEVFLMPQIGSPATIAPNMIVSKSDEKIIYHKFLFYYLKSSIGVKELEKVISGSGQPKINKTELKTVTIIYPSLSEQKQIANILSTVDDNLDVLRLKKSNYETLKKGLMEQLLTGKMRVKP